MKKKGKKKAKTEKEDGNGTGRTRKRVRYTPKGVLKRVVLIFAALYLACMGLSTVLVQQKFRQDHQEYLEDIADMVKRSMNEEISGAAARGEEITSEWYANKLEFLLAVCEVDPYVNWNAAVWNADGNGEDRVIWHLEDYLTGEELDQLAEFTEQKRVLEKRSRWTEYEKNVSWTPEGELAAISIQYKKWEKSDAQKAENWDKPVSRQTISTTDDGRTEEEHFICTESREAWRWENPDTDQENTVSKFGAFLLIPGSAAGENRWKEWSRDEYLQSFPEHIRGGYREDGTGYTESVR